jgi:hypothetical protein
MTLTIDETAYLSTLDDREAWELNHWSKRIRSMGKDDAIRQGILESEFLAVRNLVKLYPRG